MIPPLARYDDPPQPEPEPFHYLETVFTVTTDAEGKTTYGWSAVRQTYTPE